MQSAEQLLPALYRRVRHQAALEHRQVLAGAVCLDRASDGAAPVLSADPVVRDIAPLPVVDGDQPLSPLEHGGGGLQPQGLGVALTVQREISHLGDLQPQRTVLEPHDRGCLCGVSQSVSDYEVIDPDRFSDRLHEILHLSPRLPGARGPSGEALLSLGHLRGVVSDRGISEVLRRVEVVGAMIQHVPHFAVPTLPAAEPFENQVDRLPSWVLPAVEEPRGQLPAGHDHVFDLFEFFTVEPLALGAGVRERRSDHFWHSELALSHVEFDGQPA